MQQITGSINIRTTESGNGIQTDSNAASFSGLSAGDQVNAEVIEVTGREATLKTADGREIHAQFPKGIAISAGDTVELTMTGHDSGIVYLKLTSVNGQTVNLESNQLQVYLMEMGIPPSKVNEVAMQLLLHYHVEPTAENLSNLFQVAENLPELPAFLAAMMVTNKIPPTQQNAQILMKWGAEAAALGKNVTEIGNLLEQTYSEKFAKFFNDTVLRQLTPEQVKILGGTEFEKLAVQLGTSNQNDTKVYSAIHGFLDQVQLPKGEREALETVLMKSFQVAKEADVSTENVVKASTDTGQKLFVANIESKEAPILKQQPAQAAQSDAQAVRSGPTTGREEVLALISHFFARIKGLNIPADAQQLQETIQRQPNLAESLKYGIAKLMGEASVAAQKTNDLNAQVRLGNQMDQFYYCQIPFEMHEQKGTADLYVFERPHTKAAEEETNITVLIGLDTQNMGRVETVLRSQANDLSVEFRVEDSRVKQFLAQSTEELAAQLRDDEFPLSRIFVTEMNERITPLNVRKVLENEKEIRITGLDIQI